ncbi:hypothetical protein M885DRAFT_508251 [Pelagophyceae sp. CCMP2097]|nr:hypothetical protein M885DRAFT_508251 [Pelagophyceae sp. CCMP2097]
MRTMLLVLGGLGAVAAHPCDAEASVACPFDGGASLGICLRNPAKHEAPAEISVECTAFLALHDACKTEFASGTCGGAAYTDDALVCLESWLKPADVTAGCQAALPKKEEKVEVELTADELAKKAKRKRAREKAADEVRNINAKASGKPAPKKKPTKKASKYDDL